MKNSYISIQSIILILFLSSLSTPATSGELYDKLEQLNRREALIFLFEKSSFDSEDVKDLDQIFSEKEFSTEFVVRVFEKYRRNNTVSLNAYQEVILWHTKYDVIPSSTTKEEFEYAAKLFHEKAALFGGTVRVIGGFLDNGTPNRKGICRWIAPNTFIMLYVVRLAREPFFGAVFPMDGGTMVSQTLF